MTSNRFNNSRAFRIAAGQAGEAALLRDQRVLAAARAGAPGALSGRVRRRWRDEADLLQMAQPIVDQFDKESHPFHCSARMFDDGLVDPRDTRKVLALTLSVCREGDDRTLSPSTFGVARM